MEPERNLGPQPLAEHMQRLELRPHDLVQASAKPITHKLIARAMKGRRLTRRSMDQVLTAFRAASGEELGLRDLFTYAPPPAKNR